MKQFAPLIFQCIKHLTFQTKFLYSSDQVKCCATQKEHFKEKLLNKTVSSSKILHNFFFYIK